MHSVSGQAPLALSCTLDDGWMVVYVSVNHSSLLFSLSKYFLVQTNK